MNGKRTTASMVRKQAAGRACSMVWYDRHHAGELQREYPDLGRQPVSPDGLADAGQNPLADGSLNFVIASCATMRGETACDRERGWARDQSPDAPGLQHSLPRLDAAEVHAGFGLRLFEKGGPAVGILEEIGVGGGAGT